MKLKKQQHRNMSKDTAKVHGRFRNPVEAVLTGVVEFFKRQTNIRPLQDSDRLDGKTCLVTGANSGVGFAIAVEFAKRGAHLIMACRSGIPGAGEQVRRLSESNKVEMMYVDLADVNSIHRLCDQLRDRRLQLDVIVCNAGVGSPTGQKTPQGLDNMFSVNYLAKFVLLNRLLKDGVIPNKVFGGNSRRDGDRPRILFTSSDSHRNASAIDFDDLGVYRRYGVKQAMELYSYYKLVLNTFATELSRRLNPDGEVDVSVHAICPGPVDTNIARNAPPVLKVFIKLIFKLFFQKPEKAAPPLVYMACAGEEEGLTNQYLHMMARKRMDEKVYDPEAGRKLWERTQGILDGISSTLKQISK
jgi:NAD(P)-dependent dehydrogenase (short-subunit alcohol dehydrogenase family)